MPSSEVVDCRHLAEEFFADDRTPGCPARPAANGRVHAAEIVPNRLSPA